MAITTVDFAGAADTVVFGSAPWTTFGSGGTTALKLDGSGNAKLVGADSPSNLALCGQDVGGTDHFCEVTVTANSITSLIGALRGPLAVRAIDRNEVFSACFDDGGSLWRMMAWGHGGAWDSVSGSITGGDVMRLEAEGSVSRLYQNGGLILTSTIPAGLSAPTKVGLWAQTVADSDINPFVSNYRSGLLSDLAAGGGPFPPFFRSEPSTHLRM